MKTLLKASSLIGLLTACQVSLLAQDLRARPQPVEPPAKRSTYSTGTRSLKEVRAMWVTRWDYISAYDVRTIVKNCSSLGINRIYFQVRGQADAFYRSSYEPWGEELIIKGKPPTFDPLKTIIDEAKRQGIQVFAWANVLPGWKGSKAPKDRRHLVHTHPEWFMQDQKGRRPLQIEEKYTLLNPCNPQVRAHLGKVFNEIAKNYAVDGVQLDYIRFLHRNVKKSEDVPFDYKTLADFRRRFGGSPKQNSMNWDAYRARSMDRLVAELSLTVKRARPGTLVSVAAYNDLDLAQKHLFQDVPYWIRQGWVDEACPMIYTKSAAKYEQVLRKWRHKVSPDKLVPGIGLYMFDSGRKASEQLLKIKHNPCRGYVLFSYTNCFLSRSPHSSRSQPAADLRAQMRRVLKESNSKGLTTLR